MERIIKEIRELINVPNYDFENITIFPLINKISATIFVKSKNYAILHSCKPTPQEVAIDLNDQYERFMNTKHEQVTLN